MSNLLDAAPRSFTSQFEVLPPTNAAKNQGKSKTNKTHR